MQPPYNTPMVTALTPEDQLYVAQGGNRRMAKIAHIAAAVASSAAQGPKGDAGPQGAQGPAGAKGETGAAGATGQQGVQGLKGETGATGAVGPQGATGSQGQKGDVGPAGSTGAQGATGAPGAQGVAGSAGTAGAAGAAGKDAASLLGTITITETILLAVTLAGIRRVQITTPSAWAVAPGQSLMAIPTAAVPSGYAVHDVIVTAANTISVAVSVPALAIGAAYSIPCKLHRLNG